MLHQVRYLQLKDRLKRYTFKARRIKRRCQYLIRDRLAHSFTKRKMDSFWLDIKRINKSNAPRFSPVVDGANGDTNIANAFASKFSAVLNKHSTSSSQTIPSAAIQSSLTESHLSSVQCVLINTHHNTYYILNTHSQYSVF